MAVADPSALPQSQPRLSRRPKKHLAATSPNIHDLAIVAVTPSSSSTPWPRQPPTVDHAQAQDADAATLFHLVSAEPPLAVDRPQHRRRPRAGLLPQHHIDDSTAAMRRPRTTTSGSYSNLAVVRVMLRPAAGPVRPCYRLRHALSATSFCIAPTDTAPAPPRPSCSQHRKPACELLLRRGSSGNCRALTGALHPDPAGLPPANRTP